MRSTLMGGYDAHRGGGDVRRAVNVATPTCSHGSQMTPALGGRAKLWRRELGPAVRRELPSAQRTPPAIAFAQPLSRAGVSKLRAERKCRGSRLPHQAPTARVFQAAEAAALEVV